MTNYVLITPAHNEQEFIERTLGSVVKQTVLPLKWVIVDDRSTDDTGEIVAGYAAKYPFIKLLTKTSGSERNTASKVHAINMGIAYLNKFDYDFIGNLDADVSFNAVYFEKLLDIFSKDKSLGIIGGRIYQQYDDQLIETKASYESVAGAVQLFRKKCFEEIDGYLPLVGGLEDAVAELSARYYSWKTRSIKGMVVVHHRELGTVNRSIWQARFNDGINEYVTGYSYSYHLLRLCYYLTESPVILGSLVAFTGYIYALVTRKKKIIPAFLMTFQKKEQKERVLKRLFG